MMKKKSEIDILWLIDMLYDQTMQKYILVNNLNTIFSFLDRTPLEPKSKLMFDTTV